MADDFTDPAARLTAHRAAYQVIKDLPKEERIAVLSTLAAETIFAEYTVPERPVILRIFDRSVRTMTQQMGEMMDDLRHQSEIADLQPK